MTRYTDGFLDDLRQRGDDETDLIVDELWRRHDVDVVNDVLHHLLRNNTVPVERMPAHLRSWLARRNQIPAGTDMPRLDRASAFFAKHAFRMCLILSTSSLLDAYAARPGVGILTFSYRMAHGVHRRMAETAQFLLLVQSPGGMAADGDGIPALLKVRLMHAAIRHLIRQTGRWDETANGVPICQEDLLATLMTFSALMTRDLPKLGLPVTPDEGADLLYFWNVAGAIMGIPPEIMPTSIAEAAELGDAIVRRHHGPSPEGAQLAAALLEFHRELMPPHLSEHFAPALMRHLAGDQVADWLEIPRTRWILATEHKHLVSMWLEPVDLWGKALVSRKMLSMTNYQRAEFDIPESLSATWDDIHPGWRTAHEELRNSSVGLQVS